MIKQRIMLTEIPVVEYIRHTTRVIFTVKICIFERSNEKSHFSKTKIYFHKKTTPQLLEHIGLQNMKVGVKTNFGRLAKIFQICSIDADLLFEMVSLFLFISWILFVFSCTAHVESLC